VTWPTLKVIRPAEIGATELTSSTVQEVAPATYNSGTAYAINNTVSELSGTNNTTANVYRSLQNANTNHTPSTSPLWWTFLGQTYVAYNAGTSYDSTARIADATNHLVYESLQNGNAGEALSDETFWALVGPTAPYAMFDQSNSTQTVAERSIAVTITPAGRVDSVSLFNLDAATVRIQSATSGYDETHDLTETSGIDDWYAWFFEPVVRRDELIVTDLPAYLSQTITVTIDNGSATARVGNLVVGQALDLGMTLEGADSGLLSYSKIDVDQWGDYQLTQRKRVKKINLPVVVDNVDVDKVRRLLESFDAVPTVWQGTADYSALSVYGIFRNFTIAFSYPTQSVCSLELEGLT
jgi:hypothetical protein